MRARHPYARRAPSDQPPWIDRVLWTRDDHPLAERILIAAIGVFAGVEIIFQIGLHVVRAIAAASHVVGP